MEVAGFAAGMISLASMFSSCIEGFNLVQMGRAKDHDVAILHQKLDNQKARFIAWGESIYLHEQDRQCLLDASPRVRNSAASTMHLVAKLCQGSETLTARYGLRVEQSGPLSLALTGNNGSSLRHVFIRVYSHIKSSREDKVQFGGSSLRWVISDREQYLKLVQDLRDLIDDLESLTSCAEAQERRRRIIREVVNAAPEEALPIIEEAGEGVNDSLSDAASVRLSMIRLSSIGSESTRVSSAPSYRTAVERLSTTRSDNSLQGASGSNRVSLASSYRTATERPPTMMLDTSPEEPGDEQTDTVETFACASLFDFSLDGEPEHGLPWLNYEAGELFDVLAASEILESWIAYKQDDPSHQLGWIWNKHLVKVDILDINSYGSLTG